MGSILNSTGFGSFGKELNQNCMMVIDNKYEISDIVYLKTDDEQKKRVVSSIEICPNNQLLYELSCGTFSSKHYDFEISEEKDVMADV